MIRRRRPGPAWLAAILVLGSALSGCGSSGSAPAEGHARAHGRPHGSPQGVRRLAPGWTALGLADGAILPAPPGWRRIAADPGSASAAQFDANGAIRAYLNATPATAAETLSGWSRFRISHLSEEGDRQIRVLGRPTELRLKAGRASCVSDTYATSRTRYREIACVLAAAGTHRRTVLVAAAQPWFWASEQASLRYALHHFTS